MSDPAIPTRQATERQRMHEVYLQGGRQRQVAPHVVYSDSTCPHDGCDCLMHAIDFRLKDHGRDVHDPLVRAWWDDRGFAGRCPECKGWIRFTVREKQPIDDSTASKLPQLPGDWYAKAVVI